ncbi:hypothetical protein KNP414_05936 [Paenibacillus mucilaginosus KNP414]|uniref:Uncharacterized protein n=1 Tax=Paenibacillus mucilaginosus (strain KNP414) TaxID=1036673 RepID=F8FC59_PAEMK|nr:hypothetical protein KNP414_05936 [Paenibacillus mucilaginosus KNP414]
MLYISLQLQLLLFSYYITKKWVLLLWLLLLHNIIYEMY